MQAAFIMKTNGATWKAYLDSWPKGQWFDDSDETYDGKSGYTTELADVADTAVVEFTSGVVFATEKDDEGMSLVTHFRRWQKSLTHVSVVCEIPKDQLEPLKAWLSSIKGKVITP